MSRFKHFFVCGAQRSASTYLSRCLDSHTSIEMAKPIIPEPKVFLERKSETLSPESYRIKWYKNLSQETEWLGEKSVSYIEYPKVPERILKVFTRPRFIFVLRDPVERAISNYHFSRMHGFEDAEINSALIREIQQPDSFKIAGHMSISVFPRAYLARGCYIDHLQHYFNLIPGEDILLLESKKFTSSIDEKKRLFEFLGLKLPRENFHNIPVNESVKDPDQKVNSDTILSLGKFFEIPNLLLEENYGFDTSGWI